VSLSSGHRSVRILLTGNRRSDLLVIDATDIEAEPIATIKLPVHVPEGFHGNWMPFDAL